ncbi:MAG TPA: DUF1552 domain-containing protein [Vicinamibacterales bacterium]|nr:DUF1552 domain-containing protein [Vicinamibacterales bacterium]
MFIAKRSLPRRTFLRGVGSTLALPLLDAMVPALTATVQTAAQPARRAGFIYVPHGVILNQWTPASTTPGFELPAILQPLEPFRDVLTVVSNLARPEALVLQDHACTGSWLTGIPPKRTEGSDFLAARSIDQLIAAEIGRDTMFPSLEVATEDFGALLGACMSGYSCAYMNTLSWESPTKPLPMEINPRVVFERMFGWESTNDQRRARMRADRSVLDVVTEDLSDLTRTIGRRDRTRLDEYLANVRETERRIQQAEKQATRELPVPSAPIGVPESFEDHASLMFDLLALAFQTDQTRVFTFMLCREFSVRTYPNLGVTDPHHTVSHTQGRANLIAAHTKVNTYHVQLFARFLERLRTTPDGDGSLLDHSTILYGSGMGDGNNHTPSPLPIALVGGIRVPGGRHVMTPEKTPLPNLLLALAHRFDMEAQSFGISTGAVSL